MSRTAWVLALLLATAVIHDGAVAVSARQNEGAIANGASTHRRISVGTTEDETAIKATPGIVLSITATNTNAAARFLKCYNATAANTTPGTTTPWLSLAIPPAATSAPLQATFPSGAIFDTALTCALVTGAADNDVTEVAASEILWFITYK